jgi:uncharacterized protein YcnI
MAIRFQPEGPSVRRRSRRARSAIAAALATSFALALAPSAAGHAVLSPPVVQSGVLQAFTLSVPTEREDRTTTSVELTVPPGFAIDSFAPARGWKRRVAASGPGEAAFVTRVRWSGGATRTGEAAVFQFSATAGSAKAYTFRVRQTYDDGNVVDWSGPASSDTPAPVLEARASLGGGGSSTMSIVALVTASLALVLSLFAMLERRGGRPVT